MELDNATLGTACSNTRDSRARTLATPPECECVIEAAWLRAWAAGTTSTWNPAMYLRTHSGAHGRLEMAEHDEVLRLHHRDVTATSPRSVARTRSEYVEKRCRSSRSRPGWPGSRGP